MPVCGICRGILRRAAKSRPTRAGSDLRISEWRGEDLNLRPSGYEPDELPDCSTPGEETTLHASLGIDHGANPHHRNDLG